MCTGKAPQLEEKKQLCRPLEWISSTWMTKRIKGHWQTPTQQTWQLEKEIRSGLAEQSE